MTTAFLGAEWRSALETLVRSAHSELVIVSPYVSLWGVEQVLQWLPPEVAARGRFTLITDLTPTILIDGATEPQALLSMQARVPRLRLLHQPGLHAKLYIADGRRAIITSGNLTRGGLERNKEGGVLVLEENVVQQVMAYVRQLETSARLCAPEAVGAYVEAIEADHLPRQQAPLRKEIESAFRKLAPPVSSGGERGTGAQLRTIFASAILRDLARFGPRHTGEVYDIIRREYPDLCDDRVKRGTPPRVLWKHEARFALQLLKERGEVVWLAPSGPERKGGRWRAADSAAGEGL